MVFDRNQEIFKSDKQKHFWNLGCSLIPLDISLANIIEDEFKDCCIQMHQCMFDVYCDAFNNIELYSQYSSYNPDCDFFIEKIREIIGNGAFLLDDYSLALNVMKNSKLHKNVSEGAQQCKVLERHGIYVEITDNSIILYSRKYPKIFSALYRIYHEKPRCLKYDYQHAIAVSRCDFRIFTKGFAPGFDDFLRPLSDKQRECYLDLHNYVLSKKIKPEKRSYVDIQGYIYKGYPIMSVYPDKISMQLAYKGAIHDFSCENNDRLNNFFNEIKNHEHAYELIAFTMKNAKYCNWCSKIPNNRPRCGVWWDMFGKRRMLCNGAFIISKNVNSHDVELLKQLIDIRIGVIDDELSKKDYLSELRQNCQK